MKRNGILKRLKRSRLIRLLLVILTVFILLFTGGFIIGCFLGIAQKSRTYDEWLDFLREDSRRSRERWRIESFGWFRFFLYFWFDVVLFPTVLGFKIGVYLTTL